MSIDATASIAPNAANAALPTTVRDAASASAAPAVARPQDAVGGARRASALALVTAPGAAGLSLAAPRTPQVQVAQAGGGVAALAADPNPEYTMSIIGELMLLFPGTESVDFYTREAALNEVVAFLDQLGADQDAHIADLERRGIEPTDADYFAYWTAEALTSQDFAIQDTYPDTECNGLWASSCETREFGGEFEPIAKVLWDNADEGRNDRQRDAIRAFINDYYDRSW